MSLGAVETRDVEVGHHHRPHAAVERVFERGEFNRVEPRPIVADRGQRFVGIAVAVSVSWEVLGRGQHVHVLKSIRVGLSEQAAPFDRLAKASAANHGVGGVGVDVDHRREIHVHPGRPQALPHGLPKQPNQFWVSRGTERHRPGKGPRAVKAHAQTPFRIGSDHQRHLGLGLKARQTDPLKFRPALHANHPSQAQISRPTLRFRPPQRVGFGIDGHHQELGDAFLHAQGGQHTVHRMGVFRQKGGLDRSAWDQGVLCTVATRP